MNRMQKGIAPIFLVFGIVVLVAISGGVAWFAIQYYSPEAIENLFMGEEGTDIGNGAVSVDPGNDCSITALNKKLNAATKESEVIVYESREEALTANERRVYKKFTLSIDSETNRFVHPIQGWSLDLPKDWWLTGAMDSNTTTFSYTPLSDVFRKLDIAVTVWPFKVPAATDLEAYGISSVEEYLSSSTMVSGYEYLSADWSRVEVFGQEAYTFRPKALPDWIYENSLDGFYASEMIFVPRRDVIVGFTTMLKLDKKDGDQELFEKINLKARAIGDSFCVDSSYSARPAEQLWKDTWAFLRDNLEFIINSYSGYLSPDAFPEGVDSEKFTVTGLGGGVHEFRSYYPCNTTGKLEIKQNLSGTPYAPYTESAYDRFTMNGASAMYWEAGDSKSVSWVLGGTTIYVASDSKCGLSKEEIIAFAEEMK